MSPFIVPILRLRGQQHKSLLQQILILKDDELAGYQRQLQGRHLNKIIKFQHQQGQKQHGHEQIQRPQPMALPQLKKCKIGRVTLHPQTNQQANL